MYFIMVTNAFTDILCIGGGNPHFSNLGQCCVSGITDSMSEKQVLGCQEPWEFLPVLLSGELTSRTYGGKLAHSSTVLDFSCS